MRMLSDARVCGFAATTDVAAATAFYRDVLGLTLVDENPYALVFDANGTMLRITAVQEAVIAPYTVLGWNVDDIAGEVRALVGRGVSFMQVDGIDQDDLGIWTTPDGSRIAWFHDPDGNVLSLAQHA
jgi:catechol 2,3-dioxygenase-like lactoylglutathione lyase family enzyme